MQASKLLKFAVFVGALSASGCSNRPPPVNAIGYNEIQKVVGEIKRQVSIYQGRVNTLRRDPAGDSALVAAGRAGFVCGKGLIDFDIASLALDLTATTDTTTSASLGITIPVVGPIGSVGPSGSVSKEVNDTQELTLPLYPVLDSKYVGVQPDKPAPIADALFALREALIQGGTTEGICVYDYDYKAPQSDAGGTYKISFTVTDDPKVGISVTLSVVTVGANYEPKTSSGNSLLVTFHQHNMPSKPLKIGRDGVPVSQPGADANVGRAAPRPHPMAH